MNLNCETIFDFYTFKKKKILCQLKVNPKSLKFKKTCRWLSQEQWAIFDKKLEKLLAAVNKLDENVYRFNLNPLIEVEVQKSKIPFKCLYDTIDDFNKSGAVEETENDLILECLINFQQEVPASSSAEAQEYEPKVSISPDSMICNTLPYEPYTPSKKNVEKYKANIMKHNDIKYLEANEDTYSPKPLLNAAISVLNSATLIPQYTPAPINGGRKYKENNKLNLDEENVLVKQTRKRYERGECEYIPKSHVLMTQNAPIYIPTPIEGKLSSTDNIRTFRKRSKTINGLSELLNENDKGKLITKTMQQMYGEKSKCQWQQGLKKRSMTIDEIPAELSDVQAYISSPLNEKSSQRFSKTIQLKKGVEQNFFKCMQYSENTKHDQHSGGRAPIMKTNDTSCTVTNIMNQVADIPNCDIIQEGKSTASTIDEVQAAAKSFDILQKSKEKNPFLITADEEATCGYSDLRNSTKDLQHSDVYADRISKTADEKSLSSKKIVNNLEAKFLSGKKQSIVNNFKRISETQRIESDIKPEVCNKTEKCIKDKRSLDRLSPKDTHTKVSLKRDSKVVNHGAQAIKKCRRSERSPNKPQRLIEEKFNSLNLKTHKSSLKNKELFGTDDEDDYDAPYKNINDNKTFSALKGTSISKNSNTSSKKHKHKKDR